MDGTLLNSQNQVSDRTRKAIEDASSKGAYIVLATGRILKSAVNYSEELGLRKPIISCNGAVVVDEEKNILYERSIKMDTVGTIMRIGEKNNIYYHLYDKDNFYSNVRDEEVFSLYNSNSSKKKSSQIDVSIFNKIEDIVNKKDLNIYKFIFIDDDRSKLDSLRNRLGEIEGISVCSSWSNNIEVVEREVSKGNSLRMLCDKLNIPREEVIAIGDNENDMSMIEYAGLGVAMGNGVDMVKKSADMVTSTNDEDGVAQIIEKYIL